MRDLLKLILDKDGEFSIIVHQGGGWYCTIIVTLGNIFEIRVRPRSDQSLILVISGEHALDVEAESAHKSDEMCCQKGNLQNLQQPVHIRGLRWSKMDGQ